MNRVLVSRSLSEKELPEIRMALESGSGEIIYQQGHQTIARFHAAGRDLVSKCYQLSSWKQKIAAQFGNSRARRSCRAGERLVATGISTPRPMLLIESGGVVPAICRLVTEYCGFPSLLQQIRMGCAVPPPVPHNVLKLLHQLASARCGHGDFHARNLLIGPEGTVLLIDLDGARFYRAGTGAARQSLKDRDRLLRSLRPLPEHYARFASVLGAPGEPLPGLSS